MTGDRSGRSRVTVLTEELRSAAAARRAEGARRLPPDEWDGLVRGVAAAVLPPVGTKLRLLDVGSCSNYFGLEQGDRFDVTALDLAPAHPSVCQCDFLKLEVVPGGAPPVAEAPCSAAPPSALRSLPSGSFDVAVFAMLLSVLPGPSERGLAVAKARQLLREAPGKGLLIIADTANSIGRHRDSTARGAAWVAAVEAAGFRLLSDPTMHLSRERGREHGGYCQRVACWSFVTASAPAGVKPVPLPLRGDERGPLRGRRGPRAEAQEARRRMREARAQKAALRARLLAQQGVGL